ncbi:MAG TPA: hypothetical protein VJN96_08840 [Vicinamibacterales bacterium]|nr:hypothetical protein [Vicinamibacterales bacterium]
MNPLAWSLVTPYAVRMPGNFYYSGRSMDVLTYKNAVVVATGHGGVWVVNKDTSFLDGYQTTSLADLADPDTQCLANGPDGEAQVYLGCSRTLYYLDLVMGMHGPEAAVVAAIPFPGGIAPTVYRIVVHKTERRIVVATSAGVWWSQIPPHPPHVSGYAWHPAKGLPAGPVAGLCTRSGDNVHAAMFGSGDPASDAYGIFRGTFQSNELVFARSTIVWTPDEHPRDVTRISLASCASQPDVAYAVCANSDADNKNPFRAALKYHAGQNEWRQIDIGTNQPGKQGTGNNCIAVAPDDPNLVAFGWQTGTFISSQPDTPANWTLLKNKATHSDIHGLRFIAAGQGEHTLYVAGDGGVLEVGHPKSASPQFNDKLNAFLPTLMFRDYGFHFGYGTTDVSASVDGLVSGGLQDIGVKYLKTTAGGYAAWNYLDGGDGCTTEFLTNGVLLFRESNTNHLFRASSWDAASNAFTPGVVIQVDVPIDDADKPRMWLCRRVIAPAFRNASNQLMHAVSAAVQIAPYPPAEVVLGLFADKGFANPHWQVIGRIGQEVTALASLSGGVVFAGRTTGDLAVLTPTADGLGTVTTVALPVSGGSIVQFEIVSETLVFALYTTKTKGTLLVYDGTAWTIIPLPVSEVVRAFAVDWFYRTLFIVTDTAVHQGVQDPAPAGPPAGFQTSFSWTNESTGLPTRPHGSHLSIGKDDGERFLYLSTYGRSVFRALLPPDNVAWQGTPDAAAVQVLFGVIQDGGGGELDPNSGKITIVPPRQPVEVALASLLKSERLIGSEKQASERRAALQAVRDFVDRELKAAAGR